MSRATTIEITAAEGCQGLLVQYAPVSETVLDARPEIRIASRYGAGFDTVDAGLDVLPRVPMGSSSPP